MTWIYASNGVECGAPGCLVRIHPFRIMCIGHWRVVPDELRQAIKDAKPGVDRDDAELDAIGHVQEVLCL